MLSSVATIPERVPCVELLDEAIVRVLRNKTPTERLAMVFASNRLVRSRLEGHLRSVHPDWNPARVSQEVALRMTRESPRRPEKFRSASISTIDGTTRLSDTGTVPEFAGETA